MATEKIGLYFIEKGKMRIYQPKQNEKNMGRFF